MPALSPHHCHQEAVLQRLCNRSCAAEAWACAAHTYQCLSTLNPPENSRPLSSFAFWVSLSCASPQQHSPVGIAVALRTAWRCPANVRAMAAQVAYPSRPSAQGTQRPRRTNTEAPPCVSAPLAHAAVLGVALRAVCDSRRAVCSCTSAGGKGKPPQSRSSDNCCGRESDRFTFF